MYAMINDVLTGLMTPYYTMDSLLLISDGGCQGGRGCNVTCGGYDAFCAHFALRLIRILSVLSRGLQGYLVLAEFAFE